MFPATDVAPRMALEPKQIALSAPAAAAGNGLMVIVTGLDVAGLLIAQVNDEVISTVIASPLARVVEV